MATPFTLEPVLCQSAERLPEGREWHYELKLDGFRAIGRKSGRGAQFRRRNHEGHLRHQQVVDNYDTGLNARRKRLWFCDAVKESEPGCSKSSLSARNRVTQEEQQRGATDC